MKNTKRDNSQTIINNETKNNVSVQDIIKFYSPEFMAFRAGKPLSLNEEIIAKILIYPSKGIFFKKTIANVLGIPDSTMRTWFVRGEKDIEKNKMSIYSILVQCWEKAIALHYIKRKEIVNNALEGKKAEDKIVNGQLIKALQPDVNLALREIEKYHYEREGFSNNGKSISIEQSQETTTMELSKKGTVKITKEMKQARLMMNDYLDNYYIDESD